MVDAPSTGATFMLYGDFSRYVIVDRVGLTVELISASRSTLGAASAARPMI